MDAWADARGAQARAGVQVRALTTNDELDDARAVLDAVWPDPNGGTQIARDILRAMVHSGGYVSAAYQGDRPVGAAYALVARRRDGDGWATHLHSHVAAVLPQARDRSIGAALKLHQRAWALDRQIDTIVWTFDPLVRRNVRLNLVKLGVDVDGFEVDFYGLLDDGINSGDPTDRLFAWWRLASERVVAALAHGLPAVDGDAARTQGRAVRVVRLPADIVAIREADPGRAREWRLTVRAELVAAFDEGFRVVGVDRTGDLVLERVV